MAVLITNACIGYFEEAKAESALDALKNTLALKCKAYRNGRLVEVDAPLLVPGDIIALRLGDIIPADCRYVAVGSIVSVNVCSSITAIRCCRLLGLSVTHEPTQAPLTIDQSALTGESLPVQKGKGDVAYSSSIIKQGTLKPVVRRRFCSTPNSKFRTTGQMLGVVTKTGVQTFIGRAANLINVTTDAGHFQKIINNIGNFLVVITIVGIVPSCPLICSPNQRPSTFDRRWLSSSCWSTALDRRRCGSLML